MDFIKSEFFSVAILFLSFVTALLVAVRVQKLIKELYQDKKDLEDHLEQAGCDYRDFREQQEDILKEKTEIQATGNRIILEKLYEIQKDLEFIKGRMTSPVYFSPRGIGEKPPYTGAKRGPKPKPFLTAEE